MIIDLASRKVTKLGAFSSYTLSGTLFAYVLLSSEHAEHAWGLATTQLQARITSWSQTQLRHPNHTEQAKQLNNHRVIPC